MAGESEGGFVVPIVILTIIAFSATVFIISWLTKRSKDNVKTKETKVQQKDAHSHHPKIKGGITKPKKKGYKGPASRNFEHNHLITSLKGHTQQLTGGDFSSNGKQFVTASEVVREYVPCIEKKSDVKKFKNSNYDEKTEPRRCWMPGSHNSTPSTSDTEVSLASSSSSGSTKVSRRQKKNKKKKKILLSAPPSLSILSKNVTVISDNSSSVNISEINDRTNVRNNKNSGNSNNICNVRKTNSKKNSSLTQIRYNGLSETQIHKLLVPLCIDVNQRILSGYPYQTYGGTYVYKALGYSRVEEVLGPHRLVDAEIRDADGRQDSFIVQEQSAQNNFMKSGMLADMNAKPGHFDYQLLSKTDGANIRKCMRCRLYFDTWNNGGTLCFFHPKKAVLSEDGYVKYSCCNAMKNESGCIVAHVHVFHHLITGINGPLLGFRPTQHARRPPKVYALDCEMVFTSLGFEVARATMVNLNGETLLDVFILPKGDIYDFNTQFSGITYEHLVFAIPFNEAQRRILNLVKSNDILVGHSLEGDLVVLQILHRRVVDTSLLFSYISETDSQRGSPLPRRQALKSLVKQHLGQDIQRGDDGGHNSVEDATAALNLVLNQVCGEAVKKEQKVRNKVAPLPPVLQAITA